MLFYAIFIRMISIEKYDSLSPAIKETLHNYIQAEFGHIPIVQETTWAIPDWTILHTENDTIVTFFNIIERQVLLDGIPSKIAGVNNVITPPAFRGKGYSSQALTQTTSFLFDELKSEHALLLCADAMIPFYNRLGWYTVNSTVYIEQPSGRKLWTANTMLLSPDKTISPAAIDLQGTPW
ncbi:GNAT family N-acetyltransferase [Paraflavitalea speifideaquila]|uniref:GNAT family N-acetyltransferase n=1 Tax=Paraflavitalea speifideaquila TaxID=3076558 RepID=UPI0028E6745D|nr:GNAT family N-acetyltransferase [Paraflavitalea speifideiaquila]